MQIYLYKINAPSNYINKFSVNYTTITVLEGSLKNQTSIISPSILINTSVIPFMTIMDDNEDDVSFTYDSVEYDVSYLTLKHLLTANYIFIPEFNRYYYINDIISVNQGLIQINASVDVLMTYKDKILACDGYIGRNEYLYDSSLTDDKINWTNEYTITESEVGNSGNRVNVTFNVAPNSLTDNMFRYLMSYLMVGSDDGLPIAGTQSAFGCLPKITPYRFTSEAIYGLVTNAAGVKKLIQGAKADDTKRSYILSIIAYPFPVPTTASTLSSATVSFGSTSNTITVDNGTGILNPYYLCASNFNVSDYVGNTYIDSISKYELFVPFAGWISLNYSQIKDVELAVVYSIVNYATGDGSYYILDMTNNRLLVNGACTLGVKVPLSSTNALEVSNNENNIMTSLALKTIATTVSTVIGVVGGAATGNPIVAYGSVAAGTATLASAGGTALTQLSTNYEKGMVDNVSANGGCYNPLKVSLRISKPKAYNYDNNFSHYYGRPLKQVKTLSSLSGYTIVDDIYLEGLTEALDSELELIKTLLKSGVVL